MRTLFRSLVLFAVAAALTASAGLSDAPARQKDKDKKVEEKKAEEKKVEEVGTVEVYQAKDGWRFRVKNAEGKSIAVGTVGYEKKDECLKAVEVLKATMAKAKVTEVKDDKKDAKKDAKKDDKK